ncbi:hypothetical protein GCM10023086_76540 [Streptomyces venetus]|uniref:Uncharacterized protein n=1 Tax=Streptomyces venetus TaxID=1701086 RepID=A0ABP8HKY5_9ACTN
MDTMTREDLDDEEFQVTQPAKGVAPAPPPHNGEHSDSPTASTQVVSKLSDITLHGHRALSLPIDNRCQHSLSALWQTGSCSSGSG